MNAELFPIPGDLVSAQATLNGKRRVRVRFWRREEDNDLYIDTLDPASASQRERVLRRLQERGLTDAELGEACNHLDLLAARVVESDVPSTPGGSAATLQPEAGDTERERLWERAKPLALKPNILDEVALTIRGLGVAGADRMIRLIYLILTTRFLDRPVSLAIKGPSAAGKSFPLEQVLRLFRENAYFCMTGMSDRALAYGTEPLKHRMLVLYEAAGMTSDFASYLIRSLLSEGRVRYETVEKTKDGLQARMIEREGPTGLITTTTQTSLHPENETRLLSITVSDTPEQTRQVFRALAASARPKVDLEPWRDLQQWLGTVEWRVDVPFASALAELVPPLAVRLRRDFGTLLSLIRAHAVLHQATRSRDADGRIVATPADYIAVRELTADLFADGVEATVTDTIRQTVDAVAQLNGESEGVKVSEVARVLGLDKSAAWRRVKTAIQKGYLVNNETGRGRPARLVMGDPLPADDHLLPTPEALATLVGCNPQVPLTQSSTPGVAGLQVEATDPRKPGEEVCPDCGNPECIVSDGGLRCPRCEPVAFARAAKKRGAIQSEGAT